MSTDDDFLAYVGTHWSPLVRVALLLGGTERAEAVVERALVRSYRHWSRVWHDDRADVDVLTHLLAGVYAPLARTWRGESPADDLDPLAVDPTDEAAAHSELERAVRTLTPVQRDVLVLTYVAELAEEQAADVLGTRPETVRDRLADALAAVEPVRARDDLR
jgi:DNA-directed RNA polymerase specialized sigma24 family protein